MMTEYTINILCKQFNIEREVIDFVSKSEEKNFR